MDKLQTVCELLNCGPLSVTNMSGKLCLLNCSFKNSITALDVFSSKIFVSMKSE